MAVERSDGGVSDKIYFGTFCPNKFGNFHTKFKQC